MTLSTLPGALHGGNQVIFLIKIVMLLKWWSSIRIFIQIWQYSKHGRRKILSILLLCRQLCWIFAINKKKTGQFFFIKKQENVTNSSFFHKIIFTKWWKFNF
jgi:hypothetical protein